MDQIRTQFEKIATQTEADWALFSSRLEQFSFPKKHLLLCAGKTERYLSFIESGIVRFYLSQRESELTFAFAFQNHFVSAYDSFLTQAPSTYSLQALTPVKLWRISYEDLQTVYRETEVGNQIGRHASESLFLLKSKRELSLLKETAQQRYLNLFTEQPHILQQIPLRYIASYIGITPQALSRIRRRIS